MAENQPINALAQSDVSTAQSPVDIPTLLQGLFESGQAQLQTLFELGGPVIVVLIVLSVLMVAIVLLKWWQFTTLRLNARSRVNKALRLWREGHADAALKTLGRRRQPAALVVRLAIVGLRQPSIDPATVREELTRVASAQLEHLRSHLRTLETIATLSPLLGLLGTVLGMIEAFRQLEAAGSQVDPAILSGGIWQALLTTAVGLTVAVPAVLAHNWLERKVERYHHFMENAVTQVFTRGLQPAPHLEAPSRSTPVFDPAHAV